MRFLAFLTVRCGGGGDGHCHHMSTENPFVDSGTRQVALPTFVGKVRAQYVCFRDDCFWRPRRHNMRRTIRKRATERCSPLSMRTAMSLSRCHRRKCPTLSRDPPRREPSMLSEQLFSDGHSGETCWLGACSFRKGNVKLLLRDVGCRRWWGELWAVAWGQLSVGPEPLPTGESGAAEIWSAGLPTSAAGASTGLSATWASAPPRCRQRRIAADGGASLGVGGRS